MKSALIATLFTAAVGSIVRDGVPLDPITHKVYFDFLLDGEPMGRVEFGLYGRTVPKTVKNFVAIVDGTAGLSQAGNPMNYVGTHITRIIPAFMAQLGDFDNHDGTGGDSIYGGDFIDENFHIRHTKPYMLTMMNDWPKRNTNKSQFLITFVPAHWLDGRHVAFGEVLSGFEIIDEFEIYGQGPGIPNRNITVADCGSIS